jgi:hypothetical protein
MRAEADELKRLLGWLAIDQKQVGTKMEVAMIVKISAKRVILKADRQGLRQGGEGR